MAALPATGARSAAALLLVLVLTSGCTKFLYDRIDWFVVWKVQDYVSLNDPQKAALQADVQARLDGMRTADLPAMAALIEQVVSDIEAERVSPELLDVRYYEFMAVYDSFMLGIVPLAQRFLGGLDDEQLDELFANLDEVNEEMYEDYSGSTPEEREKNRNKSAIKGIQNYTGRLNEAQRDIVRNGLTRMDDASEEWIANQRKWQAAFRKLVESRPDDVIYAAQLTQLMVYPRHLHSAEYRAVVDRNRAIANEFMAELLNTLSDRQRERVARKLRGFADILNGLVVAE